MTFYYDVASRTWAIDEENRPRERSWTGAAAGAIVVLGSIAAAGVLALFGA